jgi:hypothetical protein
MNKSVIVLAIFFLTSCRYEIKEKKTTTSSDLMEQKAVEQKSALEKTVPQEQPLSKDYRTISLYGNKYQLSIPGYFTEMSSLMKGSKYPRGNSPDVVYTNEEGTVNIAFKYTTNSCR